jgi:hypothetical protein
MPATVRQVRPFAAILAVMVFLAACSPYIADFSLEAYKNATSLKAETLALIDKSAEPYARHREAAEALTLRIDAAYEFAAGIPNNQLSAQQWAIMRDPQGDLYGGFIRDWRADGPVGATFREEKKRQIGRAFDAIICLEANKRSAARCPRSGP